LHAIEPVEDAFQLLLRNADAAVLYADPDRVRGGRGDRDGDADVGPGVLDGVVEQVGDDRAELLGIAAHDELADVVRLQRHRARLQVMPQDRQVDALAREGADVQVRPPRRLRLLAYDAGFQDLIDGVVQPVGIGQHDRVELAPLLICRRARLQRLEIEANRGDGRLQLVGDGVDEAVVLLVAADLHDQEDRVDDQPADDQRKQHETGHQLAQPVLRDDDPIDVEEDRQRDEQDTQRDEERDGLLAAGHREILRRPKA
jgi:hypothetical protein